MAEVAALTLENICLDVQIGICMFLHPSDILALRKTCKALQPSTRKRIVWMAALHRVCLDNVLFLPSFPISDMSDLELEKAAMGPRRWIELCGALEKEHDPCAILRPRTTRNIDDSLITDYATTEFFIVPGGRYLLGSTPDSVSVFDLGYTSNADCKRIASVELEGYYKSCKVQATADGMGLIIFASNAYENCYVYEIYPQSETPYLTQIAHLDFDPTRDPPAHLLPGMVIWYGIYEDRIVFRVWDYRLNHSISFSVDINVNEFECYLEVMATKTAVIVLCDEAILIWAIPPLSPQPPDFFDHNPAHMPPPLFRIPFPDSILLDPKLIGWKTISSWYFDSSHPLYFDMLCQDSKLHRFQVMLNPDLSTASLHVINASELTPHDFDLVFFEDYRICEDTVVTCWNQDVPLSSHFEWGVYTGLTSARFANIISQNGPAAKMSLPTIGQDCRLFLCPASGRFVSLDSDNNVDVLDIF